MSRRRVRGHSTPRWQVALAVLVILGAVVGLPWAVVRWQDANTYDGPGAKITASPIGEDLTTFGGVSLEEARRIVADPDTHTISVLGDSTGNQTYEWVHLWAQHLAKTNAVTVRSWDDDKLAWNPPKALSTEGRPLTIWNMSAAGRPVDYPSTMIAKAQPEEPDLIIFNFGHNNTADDFNRGFYDTVTAIRARWGRSVPMVMTLQNPETAEPHAAINAETVQHLRQDTLPAYDMGAVDVYRAFEERAVGSLLVDDGVHPNEAGARVWAETVIDALG